MQLGKYRLIRQLGKGGMGEVWEGRLDGEHGFERRVAVKCMAATGDEFEQRFLSEARIASHLHHANIVSVLDFGVSEGTWYQVLELIEGIDAHRLMDRSFERGAPVPLGLSLHICAEVAHGLAAAHSAHDEAGRALGIVHRDVSLDNIFISWAGDVKLGDFGVAKARDQAHRTMAGSTVGKASYMAPEQATAGDVDARTDLFALGCALHGLLTRRTPLSGESAMMELLAGKPLPLGAELPEDVAALISKAVQRSRSERFQSAGEMADALARARHARLDEDPRSALARYLEAFRPREQTPRAGALDALLAPLEPKASDTHVETPGGEDPTHRRQRRSNPLGDTLDSDQPPNTEPAQAPMERALTDTFDEDPVARGPLATPAAPRPRRALLLASVGAVLAATTGVAVFAVMTSYGEPEQAPPPRVVEVAPAPVAEPPKVAAPVEPSPEPVAVAPPEAKPTPPRPAVRKHEAPPKPVGQGVVAVGGVKAQRAEILVDGHSQGYAPKVLELSCGAHDLTLVTPGGEHIGPHRVEVTQLNTEIDPLKWIVE